MSLRKGPNTRLSLIHQMRCLDPEGWTRFCRIYRRQLVEMAVASGFDLDRAEEIAARVEYRLYEEFKSEGGPPAGALRKRLAALVLKEVDRYRYEIRRFYGFKRGMFWIGAKKDLTVWPEDPTSFADMVSEDLSPRLNRVRSIVAQVQSSVDDATWGTYLRIRIMEDSYDDLATEMGVTKTVLRSRVYRVKSLIERLAGTRPLDEISGDEPLPERPLAQDPPDTKRIEGTPDDQR